MNKTHPAPYRLLTETDIDRWLAGGPLYATGLVETIKVEAIKVPVKTEKRAEQQAA